MNLSQKALSRKKNYPSLDVKHLDALLAAIDTPLVRDSAGTDELVVALTITLSTALTGTPGLARGTMRRSKLLNTIINAIEHGFDRSEALWCD